MINQNALECQVVLVENYEEVEEAIQRNKVATEVYNRVQVPEKEYIFKPMVFSKRNLKEDMSSFYVTTNNFICIEKRNGTHSLLLYTEDIWNELFDLCI